MLTQCLFPVTMGHWSQLLKQETREASKLSCFCQLQRGDIQFKKRLTEGNEMCSLKKTKTLHPHGKQIKNCIDLFPPSSMTSPSTTYRSMPATDHLHLRSCLSYTSRVFPSRSSPPRAVSSSVPAFFSGSVPSVPGPRT